MSIAAYVMALCRPQPEVVFGDDGQLQPEALDRNLAQYERLIAAAAKDHGARLIAFPQFGLSGYKMVGHADWVRASLDVSGPEIARLAAAAQAAGAYVVVQMAERTPAIPDRYFLSAALLTPDGQVGMVYRKNYTLSLRTSPIDVYDQYVGAFGAGAFYPVLDTPLGRIGIIIGAEAHWPEATRSLALNGAEIIINPIAAGELLDYMKRPGADAVRPVRAFENMVYFAMTNIGLPGAPRPQAFDYHGEAISRDAGDFVLATVDIEALREARKRPAANFLAQIQPDIHKPLTAFDLWPKNANATAAPSSVADLFALESQAWDRLQASWSRHNNPPDGPLKGRQGLPPDGTIRSLDADRRINR